VGAQEIPAAADDAAVNVLVESLLRPGLRIMQAVRLPVKFGIVCAALLVPLCVAIYGVLAYAQSNISFARAERLGVAYVAPLNDLLHEIIEPGVSGTPHARDALEQLAASQSDALEVAATIEQLSAGVQAAQVITLFTQVSDNSKLTLDPDLDSYYVMAIVMDYAPKLAAARFEVRRQVAVRQLAHSQDERAEPAQVRQVKARDEVDGEQQRQQRQAEQPIAM
jgi:hypothetical protein